MDSLNEKSRFRLGVFITLTSLFFYFLFRSLISGFNFPSIEIGNTCIIKNDNSVTCTRSFDPNKFFDEIRKKADEIPKKQGLFQKLADIDPIILSYKVGFKDNSSTKIIGESYTLLIPHKRGDCPFPENFNVSKDEGKFRNSFIFSEIPEKIHELSISLNDCKQYNIFLNIPDSDFKFKGGGIERIEKYQIFISPSNVSYLYLIIISIILTNLAVKILKDSFNFIKKGLKS